MDNLRFNDFLVVGRNILCIGWCALVVPAGVLHAEEATGSKLSVGRMERASESRATATVEVQKVQRLLKLLASRYPDRYGSVDPGRLDGVLGDETKIAIRNFRSIAGLPDGPITNAQLTADILSELASMSAKAGDDQAGPAEVDCLQTPDAPSCQQATRTQPPAARPATKAPQKESLSAPAAAAAAPAQPKEAALKAQTPPEQAKSATPAAPADSAATPAAATPAPTNEKLYFVQVASLRSLAAAKREWAHIKEANRAALKGERVYFERADLKDRGVHYRILIGPEPNRSDAKTLCTYLKQNNQSCVVTVRTAAELQSNAEREREDGQQVAVDADSEAQGGTPPSASATPKGSVIAGPSKPAVAKQAPPPPSHAVQSKGLALPSAKPVARSATPTVNPATSDSAISPPASTGSAPPPVAGAAPAQPASPEKPSAATAVSPVPPVAAKPDRRDAVPTPPVAAPTIAENSSRAVPAQLDLRQAEAPRNDERASAGLTDLVIGTGRRLADGLPDLRLIAVAAALLLFSALLYRRYHRIRRAGFSTAVVPNTFPLSGMEEGPAEVGQTIAKLEGDFESPQLRDSRRIRDEFLRNVLDKNLENPDSLENQESAIRVNGSLKELLATNPAHYKSIFLNLIFLAKVGTALNRKEITPDQLNDELSRELSLLRSYFKIHLLELDERHRIRQELPGLFYCLQQSNLPNRAQGARFSAA